MLIEYKSNTNVLQQWVNFKTPDSLKRVRFNTYGDVFDLHVRILAVKWPASFSFMAFNSCGARLNSTLSLPFCDPLLLKTTDTVICTDSFTLLSPVLFDRPRACLGTIKEISDRSRP